MKRRGGEGWAKVDHVARLAARLLNAEIQVRRGAISWYARMRANLDIGWGGADFGDLYIARTAHAAVRMARQADRRTPRAWRVLWIIDSYMYEPRLTASLLSKFDRVVILQSTEEERFNTLAPGRVIVAPWGSDVVGMHAAGETPKPVDLLRYGRQPKVLEDDNVLGHLCCARGLNFQGRPPSAPNPLDPRPAWPYLLGAKLVMASSHLRDDSRHTDKTKLYVTSRWTDIISSGALVIGAQPQTEETDRWFRHGLLVEARISSADAFLEDVQSVLTTWTRDVSTRSVLFAMDHLDWRLRLRDVFSSLDYTPPNLPEALEELHRVRREVEGRENKVLT